MLASVYKFCLYFNLLLILKRELPFRRMHSINGLTKCEDDCALTMRRNKRECPLTKQRGTAFARAVFSLTLSYPA